MKKLFLFGATTLLIIQAKAQIPNPGFELQNQNGMAANWTPLTFWVFPIDSNCIRQGWDSIQVSTRDAHTGDYAYEIRVATSCGDAYSGTTKPTRYDPDSAFVDQRILFTERPAAFTFYYKLFSVQGDQGFAEAKLEDETGNMIGHGVVKLPAASTWTLASIPMQYAATDTPGFLQLNFRIHSDSALHYGSRFLFDDINHTAPAGINSIRLNATTLICYPMPARNLVSVQMNDATPSGNAQLSITDQTGRLVQNIQHVVSHDKIFRIPTDMLAQGIYYIRIKEGDHTAIGRFAKE